MSIGEVPNTVFPSLNDGTITVSGKGDMASFYGNSPPWRSDKISSAITKVVIKNGVTTIGHYAFQTCRNLTAVTIPGSVTYIGERAFADCDSLAAVTIPNSVTEIGENAFIRCESPTAVFGSYSLEKLKSGEKLRRSR